MRTPPFRLSVLSTAEVAPGMPFARGGGAAEPKAGRERTTLAGLPTSFMCSVIGTCLGTAALRKLVARHTDIDRDRATDLEVHHAAVQMAGQGGDGAKALHKALCEQHAAAIRRFAQADGEAALATLWAEALSHGEVPGAYWALLVHEQASVALRDKAFGDVHMLSHLVGAANRADIRRLAALEQENAALAEQAERLQARARDASAEHERTVQALRQQLISAAAQRQVAALAGPADVADLKQRLQDKEQQLALHVSRREESEHALVHEQSRVDELSQRLQRAQAAADTLAAELRALEQACAGPAEADEAPLVQALRGRRLLYVGGRPSSNASLRAFVERLGGDLVMHDGGIEDRKGLLAAALQSCHLVMFPVDCVDHDSAAMVKRLCARHGVPFQPLRSASLSSFVAALLPEPAAPAAASRFCLRHG